MMTERFHKPAFTYEIISYAEVAENGVVFDCYGGDAGYGELLLDRYPNLVYYYFDIDNTAIVTSTERLTRFGKRAKIKKMSCVYLDKRMESEGLDEIDCVIYDPGLRLEYIRNPKRGFVVNQTGPLDGRYDQDQGATISDIVNNASVEELIDIMKTVDIPFARQVAEAIVRHRSTTTISTTTELADIVSKAVPHSKRRRKIAPEILVILALRIYVNDELYVLKTALTKGFEALRIGGRLLTVSYHSSEARIYKEFARSFDERYAEEENRRIRVLTRKAIKASDEQIKDNPQIRAAQFRVYEKLK